MPASTLSFAVPSSKAQIARLPLAGKQELYVAAKTAYQHTQGEAPLLSDDLYDYLEAMLKQECPKWKPLRTVEMPLPKVAKKFARDPDRPMGSLDKFYPEDETKMIEWVRRNDIMTHGAVLSHKLDGSALQFTALNGKWIRATTRGSKAIDGFIAHIPASVLPDVTGSGVIRCEAVVDYSIWEEFYQDEFDGPRVMAAAVFNRLDVHPSISRGHVHLVVLRSWGFGLDDVPYSEALAALSVMGFRVVPHTKVRASQITADFMTRALENSRDRTKYGLDGVVLCLDRTNRELTDDYTHAPEWARAFKVNEDPVEIVATGWNLRASRTGRITGVINLTPTQMGNVVVRKATFNNAGWARARGLGPGCVVQVVRGGDIIPKIVGVAKRVPWNPPTPESLGVAEIGWDANKTDLRVLDWGNGNTSQLAQAIHHALATVGIEHLAGSASSQLASLPGATPLKVLSTLYGPSGLAMCTRAGISEAIAKKAIAAKPRTIQLSHLMVASGLFGPGVGKRVAEKVTALEDRRPVSSSSRPFPRVEWAPEDIIEACGPAVGQKVVDGLPAFWAETENLQALRGVVVRGVPRVSGPLSGQRVSFTGYRSKEQEAAITAAGGVVQGFSGSTTILLWTPGGKDSDKKATAAKRGIRVCQFNELGL